MEKTEKNPVKKSKIIIAWLVLIILILSTLGLTYIKFFGKNENIEEYPIDEGNKESTSPVITKALQTIVNNFNNNELIQQYQKNGTTMKASLNEENLLVEVTETNNMYSFNFEIPNLMIEIDQKNKEEFELIFKVLIYANQERLKNTNNIDNYVDGFINNNLDVEGLSRKEIDNLISYSIDISKTIGNIDTSNNTTLNSDNNSEINNIEGVE